MALPATAAIEVRTTGSDSNGGGFSAALGGTDYSQSDTPIATGTVTSVTTTVTATTSIFTSVMVGNYITDGTTWKEITVFTSATVVTVDSAPSWTAAAIKVGGALVTIGKAAALYIAGNAIWIKSGTYTITSGITFSTTGTISAPVIVSGYGTVHGDGGQATITTSTNSVAKLTMSNVSNFSVRYLKIADTAATRGNGINLSSGGSGLVFYGCTVDGSSVGVNWVNNITNVSVENSSIINCKSHGISPFTGTHRFTGCYICSNLGSGIQFGTGGGVSATAQVSYCVISGNSARGILSLLGPANNLAIGLDLNNSTISNNGTDGVYFSGASTGTDVIFGQNNLIYGNGGAGVATQVNTNDRNNYDASLFDFNFYGSNTSGNYSNILPGLNDNISLTVSPFTNSAAGDFSLNATAGGGAVCRAAGFPGAFPGGLTTGYLDIGAAQHQASGGSGLIVATGMRGGMI